eukprot:29120-Pelagococcus_subviridis.AAC.28
MIDVTPGRLPARAAFRNASSCPMLVSNWLSASLHARINVFAAAVSVFTSSSSSSHAPSSSSATAADVPVTLLKTQISRALSSSLMPSFITSFASSAARNGSGATSALDARSGAAGRSILSFRLHLSENPYLSMSSRFDPVGSYEITTSSWSLFIALVVSKTIRGPPTPWFSARSAITRNPPSTSPSSVPRMDFTAVTSRTSS